MAKKTRSADTASGAAQAFLDAALGLPDQPKHITVREQDQPYWEAILTTRSRSEWTDVSLCVAAQLARTQAELAEWQARLDLEGPTEIDLKGRTVANPLVGVIEAATRRQLSLMRNLGLAAGDPRDQASRSEALKKAQTIRKQLAGEPLLAQ